MLHKYWLNQSVGSKELVLLESEVVMGSLMEWDFYICFGYGVILQYIGMLNINIKATRKKAGDKVIQAPRPL